MTKIVLAGYKCPRCGNIMRYPGMNKNKCADCNYPYSGIWETMEGVEE